jgi:hypothetical protein
MISLDFLLFKVLEFLILDIEKEDLEVSKSWEIYFVWYLVQLSNKRHASNILLPFPALPSIKILLLAKILILGHLHELDLFLFGRYLG